MPAAAPAIVSADRRGAASILQTATLACIAVAHSRKSQSERRPMTRSTSDISGMSRNVFVRLAVGALRCALVRAIGRDRLTTLEVLTPRFRSWQSRVSAVGSVPEGKARRHDAYQRNQLLKSATTGFWKRIDRQHNNLAKDARDGEHNNRSKTYR